MDVIEAAKLVKAGMLLRRKAWPLHVYCGLDDCGLYLALQDKGIELRRHFSIEIDELLADDWEVLEPITRPKGLSLKK